MNNYKNDFPILNDETNTYLDSAATSQKPQCVIDAIDNYYKTLNSNPHRGAYALSIKATEAYDEAREKTAKLLNSESANNIVFAKNATECFNLIAYSYGLTNVKENDEIVLSILEHHSNLIPWQFVAKTKNANLKYMYINKDFEIPDEEIETKITNKTRIVGITYVSNVTGTINDVKKIIEKAHEVGAVVVLDATQAISHIRVDVQDLDADFVVFSGHKVYAPMGIGVLYGKKNLLKNMSPFLMGGGMIDYVYEQDTTFADIPGRFEAGTQNVESAVGLGAAIDYINNIGYDKIQEIENDLLDYAISEFKKLDFVDLYFSSNRNNHASLISFNIKGVHPHDVATILDGEGVCVRSGNHCAQPLLRYIGVDSTCRASFAIYNTREDVDKLINAIKKAYDVFKKYI